jgi:CRP-like cAMP-binding protein
MLIPRYFFTGEFTQFYNYFLTCPHVVEKYKKNDYLWPPGEKLTHVFYIHTGIAQTFIEHEEGYKKILSFHGKGTIFPMGSHRIDFKIENAHITKALMDMTVLKFTRQTFYSMAQENKALNAQVLDWLSMFINLLIYETAHQEYNKSFIKLCNLLYVFSKNSPFGESNIEFTQEDIANILALDRVNVANNLARLREENIIITHRNRIEITNPAALQSYCTGESVED